MEEGHQKAVVSSFPFTLLQPGNPTSALSRLAPTAPVASPASAGTQQAINMLKEQNRLLTKVSRDGGEESTEREPSEKEYVAVESDPSAWPTLVILEMGHGLRFEPFPLTTERPSRDGLGLFAGYGTMDVNLIDPAEGKGL